MRRPSSSIEILVAFPAGATDDDVDAMTQALIYLHTKSVAKYKLAMDNLGSAADQSKKKPQRPNPYRGL